MSNNLAFIDGQNLYFNTAKKEIEPWMVDLARLRIYLEKKYQVKEDFDKIVLVSGDGDYKLLVDFLIEEGKFERILFPDQKYRSSLYKQLPINYFASLDDPDVKNKISYEKKRKGSLGS